MTPAPTSTSTSASRTSPPTASTTAAAGTGGAMAEASAGGAGGTPLAPLIYVNRSHLDGSTNNPGGSPSSSNPWSSGQHHTHPVRASASGSAFPVLPSPYYTPPLHASASPVSGLPSTSSVSSSTSRPTSVRHPELSSARYPQRNHQHHHHHHHPTSRLAQVVVDGGKGESDILDDLIDEEEQAGGYAQPLTNGDETHHLGGGKEEDADHQGGDMDGQAEYDEPEASEPLKEASYKPDEPEEGDADEYEDHDEDDAADLDYGKRGRGAAGKGKGRKAAAKARSALAASVSGHSEAGTSVNNAAPLSVHSTRRVSAANSRAGTLATASGNAIASSSTTPSPGSAGTNANTRAGQTKMFQCTGFGECAMVFSRSEHLARHIRKHTGERPFKCRCGRAFSRLDNLRQHSQTVHHDQPDLNAEMLSKLSTVHSTLSANASKVHVGVKVPITEMRAAAGRANTPRSSSGRSRSKNKQEGSGSGEDSLNQDSDSPPAGASGDAEFLAPAHPSDYPFQPSSLYATDSASMPPPAFSATGKRKRERQPSANTQQQQQRTKRKIVPGTSSANKDSPNGVNRSLPTSSEEGTISDTSLSPATPLGRSVAGGLGLSPYDVQQGSSAGNGRVTLPSFATLISVASDRTLYPYAPNGGVPASAAMPYKVDGVSSGSSSSSGSPYDHAAYSHYSHLAQQQQQPYQAGHPYPHPHAHSYPTNLSHPQSQLPSGQPFSSATSLSSSRHSMYPPRPPTRPHSSSSPVNITYLSIKEEEEEEDVGHSPYHQPTHASLTSRPRSTRSTSARRRRKHSSSSRRLRHHYHPSSSVAALSDATVAHEDAESGLDDDLYDSAEQEAAEASAAAAVLSRTTDHPAFLSRHLHHHQQQQQQQYSSNLAVHGPPTNTLRSPSSARNIQSITTSSSSTTSSMSRRARQSSMKSSNERHSHDHEKDDEGDKEWGMDASAEYELRRLQEDREEPQSPLPPPHDLTLDHPVRSPFPHLRTSSLPSSVRSFSFASASASASSASSSARPLNIGDPYSPVSHHRYYHYYSASSSTMATYSASFPQDNRTRLSSPRSHLPHSPSTMSLAHPRSSHDDVPSHRSTTSRSHSNHHFSLQVYPHSHSQLHADPNYQSSSGSLSPPSFSSGSRRTVSAERSTSMPSSHDSPQPPYRSVKSEEVEDIAVLDLAAPLEHHEDYYNPRPFTASRSPSIASTSTVTASTPHYPNANVTNSSSARTMSRKRIWEEDDMSQTLALQKSPASAAAL